MKLVQEMLVLASVSAADVSASDLASSELDALSDLLADDLVQLYGDVLTGLLDQHCPAVKVR